MTQKSCHHSNLHYSASSYWAKKKSDFFFLKVTLSFFALHINSVFLCFFFCSGGVSNSRKRAFTRLILDKACCFFLPPFSFQIRVGGLYLLYSLHGCQTAVPTQHVRNIRNASHVETAVLWAELFFFLTLLLYMSSDPPGAEGLGTRAEVWEGCQGCSTLGCCLHPPADARP